MKRNRAVLTAAATAACILASIAGAHALWRDGGAERERPAIGAAAVHYAPAENPEHIDVGLIDRAKTSIDMAAYVLTDWAVIQALTRAADRGVMIRVYLDGGQFGARDLKQPFLDLRATPGVQIKAKPPGGPLMHFKAYQVDGRVCAPAPPTSRYRSLSGLKRQDNDLVVIESQETVEAFDRNFERVFAAGETL